jgi:hypothetical protein
MKIYLSTNYRTLDPVLQALNLISDKLKIELFQANYFDIEELIVFQIIETIKKVDVVIADISNENPNIYYEIGIAHSLGKPVILISQSNNFNRFSLFSNRFYHYDTDLRGIQNLSFRLEQILTDNDELNKLRPLPSKKHILDFEEFANNNRLNEIQNLSGAAKFYALEKWIYSLLGEIPGFEVQYNEQRSGKEYDFIVWNSNESEELRALGNPIPIEVKASNYVENNLIHSLISKASSQGFTSFILITMANLTEGNRKLIRNLKLHSGISILVIDGDQLKEIASAKDLLKAVIKSFRTFFIY